MSSEEKKQKVKALIEETYIDMYYMPVESALVPDWFLRYWDLAEAIYEYFDLPFAKPELTYPDQVK